MFAASDVQALGVLEAARGLGIDVPEQLSVIGFDDIEIASYVGLTTVRQPLFESGRRGAELLLQALAGEPAPHASRRCRSTSSSAARLVRLADSRYVELSGVRSETSYPVLCSPCGRGAVAPSARMTNPIPARMSAMPTTRLKSESWVAM